jgi:hypothetical protein
MAQAMGGPPKTEHRRRHTFMASSRPWVRRAEGYRGTRHVLPSRQVPVKLRRPPSLPLICGVFPAHSSFSVFRGTPMAFSCDYFKELNCYPIAIFRVSTTFQQPRIRICPLFLETRHHSCVGITGAQAGVIWRSGLA